MKYYEELSSTAFWLNVADFCEELSTMSQQEAWNKLLNRPICVILCNKFAGPSCGDYQNWEVMMNQLRHLFTGMGYTSGHWPIGKSISEVHHEGRYTYLSHGYWGDNPVGERRRDLALEMAEYIRSSLGVQT